MCFQTDSPRRGLGCISWPFQKTHDKTLQQHLHETPLETLILFLGSTTSWLKFGRAPKVTLGVDPFCSPPVGNQWISFSMIRKTDLF